MGIGLVNALVRVDGASQYTLICSRANQHLFRHVGRAAMRTLGHRRRHPVLRIVHDQATVPWLCRRDTDLLLTPSTVGSMFASVPQVVIVQGALSIPAIRREVNASISAAHRLYFGSLMRPSHRRAAAVVAHSRYLAERLVRDTGLPSNKVHTILGGVDPADGPTDRPAVVESPYVLFVGTLYPYKNADVLIRALAMARPRLPTGIKAVIAGRDPDGRQVPALTQLAGKVGVEDALLFTGKVSGEELSALYAGASALVFPSSVESFGFPPLEAMRLDVPVIAANRASVPEVVGGAAVLVDPDRPDAIGDAMVEVLGNEELRRRLVEAGRARVAELSWDRAARSFIALFQKLAR